MIAVTGATGHLGRLVIEDLLGRGVEPAGLAALARTPAKASDLRERGVEVREADYTKPVTLDAALEGVDRLLLISSSEVGQRASQHENVIKAAKKADVDFLVYTSMLRADTSPMQLAAEHEVTEEQLRASGIPYAILRNGWYIENYTEQLDQVLEHGAFFGSAEEGRISAATRADYAAAAATVLAGGEHEGAVYELGGDKAFTMAELADEVSRQSEAEVVYRDLPEEEYTQVLIGAGVPEPYAAVLADSDRGVAEGHLYVESGDLRKLIGRPTTSMSDAVGAALRA